MMEASRLARQNCPHTCICIAISMRKSLTIATHTHGPQTVRCHMIDEFDGEEGGGRTRSSQQTLKKRLMKHAAPQKGIRVRASLDHTLNPRGFLRGSVSQKWAKGVGTGGFGTGTS